MSNYHITTKYSLLKEDMCYLNSGSGLNKREMRSNASGSSSTWDKFTLLYKMLSMRWLGSSPKGWHPPVMQKLRTQPKLNMSEAFVSMLLRSCSGAFQPKESVPIIQMIVKYEQIKNKPSIKY